MNKLWLIIKREYLSRVKKRSFILTTLLAPLGFLIFTVVVALILGSGADSKRMAVLDESSQLQFNEFGKLKDGLVYFSYPKTDLETLKKNYEAEGYDGFVYIEPNQQVDSAMRTLNINYFGAEDLGLSIQMFVKKSIGKHLRKMKMELLSIDQQKLDQLETDIVLLSSKLDVDGVPIEDSGADAGVKATFGAVLGTIMSLLLYLIIFIYGSMVMRSVMEEKTNRIVEVIISSVKPFQLMLGKIIGVGAVGITQLSIWAVVFPLVNIFIGIFFAGKLENVQQVMNAGSVKAETDVEEMMMIIQQLMTFDYSKLVFFFILFFIGGYVLYASLFAAIGAAMGDDMGEGQALTLVVSIPVIMALYIGMAITQAPNSSLAVWSSMFPLFSPIVMPTRIVFDPPLYQVFISLLLLILTAVFFTWVSGRIYRVGILMYGKKVTLKELSKWMFRKD